VELAMNRTRITIELFDRTRVRIGRDTICHMFVTPIGRPRDGARDGEVVPPASSLELRSRWLSTLRKIVAAAVLVAAVMLLLGAQSTRLTRRPGDGSRDRVASRVRDCLRSEVAFARPGASPDELRAAVGSIERLILRRGGVAIDTANADRLVVLEEAALRDAKLLTLDDLAGAASVTLLERVRDAGDAEIAYAADVFGNVSKRPADAGPEDLARSLAASKSAWRRERARAVADGGDAKPSPDRLVMLRYTGAGTMSTEEFVALARHARARLQLPHGYALAIGAVERVAREMLERRLDLFRNADPERWERAAREGMTPLEALLLVYSVASDDRLIYTTDELRAKIREELKDVSAAGTGATVGDCAPFGPYGQRFSMPLDLALEPKTLDRLLDRIEERTIR
jgi:hypothetical protein